MQDTHTGHQLAARGGTLISHVRGGIAGLEKEIAQEENKRLRRHCLSDNKSTLKRSGGGGVASPPSPPYFLFMIRRYLRTT